MDNFLQTLERLWENSFVKAAVYLVVAIVVSFIASFIVKRLFKLMKLDKRFDGWGINEGQNGTARKFIGKLTFLIVFLLFLPAVLGALGLESVSTPISDFAATFIRYIPNVIAAAVLVFIGILIGQILSSTITVLLKKTKIDSLCKKLGKKKGSSTESSGECEEMEMSVSISSAIGKAVGAAVILVSIVEALKVLNIETVSKPAITVIERIFDAVPDLILAALVVTLGFFIANIAAELIENLLGSLGIDRAVKSIMPKSTKSISLAKITANVARALIILFIVAQGVDILGLEIISEFMSVIISYLPMIIKALAIALIALIAKKAAENAFKNSKSQMTAKLIKAMIYTIAAFMVLSQLDFAPTIVNLAFIIILSSIGVAFAISFGIGGRDFAKKTLQNVNLNSQTNSNNDSEAGNS